MVSISQVARNLKVGNHGTYAKLKVGYGTDISEAAQEAVMGSNILKGKSVNFEFNGVLLTGKAKLHPAAIERQYARQLEKQSEIHHNSFDGKAKSLKSESEWAQIKSKAQQEANELLPKLKESLKSGEASTVKLISDLDTAMSRGAKIEPEKMKKLMEMLKSKGYVANGATNLAEAEYKNPSTAATYIIGQFMNQPGTGIVKRFADAYSKLISK